MARTGVAGAGVRSSEVLMGILLGEDVAEDEP